MALSTVADTFAKSFLSGEGLLFPDFDPPQEELVAVGGDLSCDRLLLAYRNGIFPWSANPITWWSPERRGVFDLDRFHVPRSLAKLMRRQLYHITRDEAFRRVIEGCAAPARGRQQTWIHPEFIEAYTRLHELGHAHSVECWRGQELVGGIYGVSVGGLFAGESMFHRADNASKIALVHLANHLRERGFQLFDIQMLTPATQRLGAVEISRAEYLRRLCAAVQAGCEF